MARDRKLSYVRDVEAGTLAVHKPGDQDGKPLAVFDINEFPDSTHRGLILEGFVKKASQESATEGGADVEEILASYRATFERIKSGQVEKPREGGERAPQASKVMVLTLQHVLKAKGHSPDKWMSLAVNLGLAGADGSWKADSATQRAFLTEKAAALPLFADALSKAKAGEPAVEIEELDLGL